MASQTAEPVTTATHAARAIGSSLQIRGVSLPNRVVGAPMERNYCDLSGRVTARYRDYLVRRAAGGVGLLFTESCYITQASKARPLQMGLHGDHVVEPLSSLADAVHAKGGLLGVELNHAGRVVPSSVSQLQPVAPSAVACAEIGGEIPRALSHDEIDEIVAAFAAAAVRSVRAGVDVVSVHGAHGYLIGQFLSPRSNHRTDEYGEPTAFLNRVLEAVRTAVGPDVPVFLRLSAFEGLPGGVDENGALDQASAMRLDLVDVIDISAGTYGAGQWITPSGEVEEGYLAATAQHYRRFGLPVSVAGRITTAESAERVLADGMDLVVIGRALHADPDWARHAIAGTEPRPCISCNQGCADVIHRGRPLWCAVNPGTGREGRVAVGGRGSGRPRVLVLGGGPAGMEAALTAAARGLQVVLAERTRHLGGQFRLASRLRSKPQFERLLTWYRDALREAGVDLLTSVARLPDDIADSADAVVVATGGQGYVPPVPGSERSRVVDIRDWLSSETEPSSAEVTVWGADRGGTYLADELCSRGYRVTLVGSQRELAPDAGARERLPAVQRIRDSNRVRLHLGVGVERIDEETLLCIRDGVRFVIDAPGPVVASHGVVPRIPHGLSRLHSADRLVVTAGDAGGGATLDEAVASGRQAVEQIVGAWAVLPG